jgi:hypothetical protein
MQPTCHGGIIAGVPRARFFPVCVAESATQCVRGDRIELPSTQHFGGTNGQNAGVAALRTGEPQN